MSTSVVPVDFNLKILRFIYSIYVIIYHNIYSPQGIKTNLLWFADGFNYFLRHPKQFLNEVLIVSNEYENNIKKICVSTKLLFPDKDECMPLNLLIKMNQIQNLEIKVIEGYHAWFFLKQAKLIKEIIDFFQ